ncbi:MAG TPA: hypothetical protein VK501_12775 [Baekduia sp.]|uniref:hypothetical protein n=1 Tax=Baekduia sp. TaxID=2600305 RepID=UPI002C0FF4E6|nr:hypothetical protein [Baekduia sp.]HMJ34779.1 hypothetical protein [Baekduia sp.]
MARVRACVPEDPRELAKRRPSDVGAPAWCSPPGSNVLTQAIAQTPWILERIHAHVPELEVFFDWDTFARAQRGLLLWEAFVSGKAKHHQHDAQIAILRFVDQLPHVGDANANETERPFSLVAAAAVWAGFDVPAATLRHPCVLVRAQPAAD